MFGLTLSKPAIYAAVVAVVLALAGLGFWRGVAAIKADKEAAVAAAIETRDTYWRGEIAMSNAIAERERAAMAERATSALQDKAEADKRADAALSELEKKNAEMPGGDGCGLSAERGGLLDAIR